MLLTKKPARETFEDRLFALLESQAGVSQALVAQAREQVLLGQEHDPDTQQTESVSIAALGQLLVEQGSLSPGQWLHVRGKLYRMDVQEHLPSQLDPFFVPRVPISFLRSFLMVPVATRSTAFIAMANPAFYHQADDLRRLLDWEGMAVKLCAEEEVLAAINRVYDTEHAGVADQVIQDIGDGESTALLSALSGTVDLLDDDSDAPVVRLVNLMLSQAVRDKASDLHVEPFRDQVKIRKRVDGLLYDMYTPPRHVQERLVSRIKIMAGMDTAETRRPQDGRMDIRIGEKNIDIRVSTLPTSCGERVVMRLLDKSGVLLSLEDLGFSAEDFAFFQRLISAPHGIILVTGPTGSGKTTSLYSALGMLNTPDVNIITVEDPVEYQLAGISQMQVNSKIGLTFAAGLRTIVRQDPDIILVGEIRDLETAEIAIQSALTGHLVFSTLHTNDAASAVTRLIDMGVASFLVSSSVNGIVAQRLVRKLCDVCREPFSPPQSVLQQAGFNQEQLQQVSQEEQVIYRHTGCPACHHMGYSGRVAIFEILELTPELKHVILTTSDSGQIRDAALQADPPLRTLRQDGLIKVLAGVTTLEEVFRVT